MTSISLALQAAEADLQKHERKLSKFISKSQPYFEQKDSFNKALEAQKARVQAVQREVTARKKSYAQSLRNLEEISESIHARRKLKLPREPGVGAEYESFASYDLDECDRASFQ